MFQTWTKMNLSVARHLKDNEERGYTLIAVDEIMQILDDNTMTLQGIAASP